jgi:hypothetical protein
MSQRLLIAIAFVLMGVCVIAQDLTPSASQDSTANSIDLVLRQSNPLLIINAGDRSLEIPPSKEPYDSFSIGMYGIEKSWIQSFSVISGQKAVDEHGALAQSTVLIVELKEDAFEKMPAELAQRFKFR